MSLSEACAIGLGTEFLEYAPSGLSSRFFFIMFAVEQGRFLVYLCYAHWSEQLEILDSHYLLVTYLSICAFDFARDNIATWQSFNMRTYACMHAFICICMCMLPT